MSLNPGSSVGPYEIVALIGAGGMGEVYRARDTRLGRDVAIKVLPAEFAADPERLRRFEQEARAVAALNHPNILAIHDVGTHDGAPYLVTELLEGETLRADCRPERSPRARRSSSRSARERAGRRARQGHRPPGPQAGQRLRHHGRRREDPRLRPGQGWRRAHARTGRRRRRSKRRPTPAGSSERWRTCRRSRCADGASTTGPTSSRSASSCTRW